MIGKRLSPVYFKGKGRPLEEGKARGWIDGLRSGLKARCWMYRNLKPWPRPLAQTWHAKSESHSSCLLNIKAVIAFYDHVAPPDPVPVSGRGGRA